MYTLKYYVYIIDIRMRSIVLPVSNKSKFIPDCDNMVFNILFRDIIIILKYYN